MKKTKSLIASSIILVMLIALMITNAFGGFNVYADSNFVKTTTVIGNSEVAFKPDTAIVVVGVETLNSSLIVAQKENTKTMEKIVQTLLSNNIVKDDIKTKNFFVREKYDYSKGQEFIGNQVSNYIEFKTKDIDGLTNLLTLLTEDGANAFNGINFTLEDTDKAYAQALTKALDNAKVKAKILNVSGATLQIKEIKEQYTSFSSCYFDSFNLAKGLTLNAETSGIQGGNVCVRATVEVMFEEM